MLTNKLFPMYLTIGEAVKILTKLPHCAFAGSNLDTSITSALVFNALSIIHIKGNTVNIPAIIRTNIFPNAFPKFPKTSMLFSNAAFLSDAPSLSVLVIDEYVFFVPKPVYLFSFTIFCCIFLSLSKVSFTIFYSTICINNEPIF